jgi:hypothetical protein
VLLKDYIMKNQMSKIMKREKPGRKPIQDKKRPITIYVQESVIENYGAARLRLALVEYVESLEVIDDEN